MNINNSIQKTMQSTQMDYEISSPPLYPYNIHYIQALLHSFCCTLLKPEWKLLVVWLGWSLTLLLLYPVLVLVPHAPGPHPGPWTVDPSLTAAGDTGRCSTGHWSLHVPAVCQCAAGGAAQSSEAAAGWLEAAVPAPPARHSRPCPCSLHHHHTSPSTPAQQQKTSTNIIWGQIILGLSLKLILNPHNKDF